MRAKALKPFVNLVTLKTPVRLAIAKKFANNALMDISLMKTKNVLPNVQTDLEKPKLEHVKNAKSQAVIGENS